MIGEWWCIGDTCWLTWFDEYHGIFVHLGEPMIFGSTYYYFSLAASREWKPPGFQLKWKASFGEESNYLTLTGWWFQPIWKIWSSKWESSPSKGEHKKTFELPPPSSLSTAITAIFFTSLLIQLAVFRIDSCQPAKVHHNQNSIGDQRTEKKTFNAFQVRIKKMNTQACKVKKSEHILHPNHLKWSQTSTKHANISINWLVVSTHLKNMIVKMGEHLPHQFTGWKYQKSLSSHHPNPQQIP